MCLVHKPDCIVLGVRDDRGLNTFKALAQVAYITPGDIRWRPVTDVIEPEAEFQHGDVGPAWRGKPQ